MYVTRFLGWNYFSIKPEKVNCDFIIIVIIYFKGEVKHTTTTQEENVN